MRTVGETETRAYVDKDMREEESEGEPRARACVSARANEGKQAKQNKLRVHTSSKTKTKLDKGMREQQKENKNKISAYTNSKTKTKLDEDIHQQQKENRTGQSHASFNSNQVQEKWDSKGMHQQQVRRYQNEVITYTSRERKQNWTMACSNSKKKTK